MPDVYLDGITDLVREVLQPAEPEEGLTSQIIPKPRSFESSEGLIASAKAKPEKATPSNKILNHKRIRKM